MVVRNGIVTYYDGTYGEVKKGDDKFIFLTRDMEADNIQIGQIVSFRGEEIQGVKRAYFIKSLEPTSTIKNKEKKKELL